MPVGEHDLLHLDTLFGDCGFDAFVLTARIDHGSLVGVLAPQNRTVLLEWGDGNNDSFHGTRPVVMKDAGLIHCQGLQ